MLQEIGVASAAAEARQVEAQNKEKELEVSSVQIAADKADAEAALEEALPALEEAAQALNDLKKDDITELKSFANPNEMVRIDEWARHSLLPSYFFHPSTTPYLTLTSTIISGQERVPLRGDP